MSVGLQKKNKHTSVKKTKENKDFLSEVINENFSHVIDNGIFPDQCKKADIKPIFKDNLPSNKVFDL